MQKKEEDRVFWTASKCGVVSVKSLYSILELKGSSLFPWDSIWRVRVPPKVAFFTWETSWGKVLTLEQLQRRGFFLANKCFLYLSEVETMNHLFTSLCQDAGLVESSFLPFWCDLDSFMYNEGNSSWVAWNVCGESS